MIRLLAIIFFLISTVSLIAQTSLISEVEELENIATKFQFSQIQKVELKQLIKKRNADLKAVSSNLVLDERQRAIKRLSIVKGFDGSLNLLLNEDQRQLAQIQSITNRKERIAAIEELKKKGYSQAEILKQLDHK